MPIPPDFKEQLLKRLAERKVHPVCEICGHNTWGVVDQAATIIVSNLEGGFVLPPPAIPCAALICNHCGNVRLLALGALGLMPPPEGGQKK